MKPFWKSKTLWINLLMAIAAFFPAVQAHLDAETMGMVFAGVNGILRVVTKEKVSLN